MQQQLLVLLNMAVLRENVLNENLLLLVCRTPFPLIYVLVNGLRFRYLSIHGWTP